MTNPFVKQFLESGGRTPEEYAQHLGKFLAGMPCCNRETAAEKAAAHRLMDKWRARDAKRVPKILERLRRETAKLKAKGLL